MKGRGGGAITPPLHKSGSARVDIRTYPSPTPYPRLRLDAMQLHDGPVQSSSEEVAMLVTVDGAQREVEAWSFAGTTFAVHTGEISFAIAVRGHPHVRLDLVCEKPRHIPCALA